MSGVKLPPNVTRKAIRRHYDLATPFYRMLWGPHIHHGLWDGDESPRQAQRQLTERLAAEANVKQGDSVLDVGCGMGGSSIHLAREFQCQVRGLTLSPVQRFWATMSAKIRGLGRRAQFICHDAESIEFGSGSFDVIWSIECTEHLFEKAAFFQRAAQWLKPGGRIAICAWLAGDEPHSPDVESQVAAVCEAFLCPSLGTAADYVGWMRDAGLVVETPRDWTSRVKQTWEICDRRVRRTGMNWLARLGGRDMAQFSDHFRTILRAFETGAMKYGCFIASKPGSESHGRELACTAESVCSPAF
jgi:tocopherol O-methyltransferase